MHEKIRTEDYWISSSSSSSSNHRRIITTRGKRKMRIIEEMNNCHQHNHPMLPKDAGPK